MRLPMARGNLFGAGCEPLKTARYVASQCCPATEIAAWRSRSSFFAAASQTQLPSLSMTQFAILHSLKILSEPHLTQLWEKCLVLSADLSHHTIETVWAQPMREIESGRQFRFACYQIKLLPLIRNGRVSVPFANAANRNKHIR